MFKETTNTLDLTTIAYTDPISILNFGTMTIQPVGVGSGNVTIEVSLDNITFDEFDPRTTDYDVNELVMIKTCDWLYWRWKSDGTGTGTFEFNIMVKI